MQNVLFIDLQTALTDGKPFTGFAPNVDGPFIDFHGREVEVKPSDIKRYLTNTLKAIQDMQAKGMDGLPIDAEKHDKGKAAGWIVGAELAEIVTSAGKKIPVIQFLAKWTKLGRELIEERILTNFSPTFDLDEQTVWGGSLTNWPASVDERGIPLFNAIELSQGVRYLQESLDEKSQMFYDAFRDKHGPRYSDEMDTWLVEVFDEDGFVIARQDKDFYRVPFERDGDELTFAERDDWTKVKKAWVDMQRKQRDLTGGGQRDVAAPDDSQLDEGDREMGEKNTDTRQDTPASEVNLAELRQQIRQELAAEVRNEVIAELAPGGDGNPEDAMKRLRESLNLEAFADVADLSQARDAMLKQMKAALEGEYNRMQKQAGSMLADMMQQIKRDQRIAELSQNWTSGTEQNPRGLPVGREEIETFLTNLSDKNRAAAESILGRIWESGLTEYTELGHGKRLQGTAQLDPEIARQLRKHVDNGGRIKDFFAAAGDVLGDMAQYNLSEYEEKDNG